MNNLHIPLYADLTDLQQKRPFSAWKAPVMVAIDEAQNLPKGPSSDLAKFLRLLHEGATTLPVTLVLAGLGDTQSVIQDLGLTHGLQPYALGCFTPEE